VAIEPDDIDALAGEYVLGTLDPAERSAAEARLAADPAFRAAVATWAIRLQPLAAGGPKVEPHPGTYERIAARIDVEPRPGGGNVVALRRAVARWRAAAFVAAAATVVLAVFVGAERLRPPPTEFVAMLTPDGAAPAFVLTVDTERRTLSIRRVVDAAPTDKSYELWAVEPGAQPKSLGVVEQASLTVGLPYSPQALVFAVSLEPKGGSPTGAVTGPVVYSGPLVPAE
jgi:anti-sigma-K factor RskA